MPLSLRAGRLAAVQTAILPFCDLKYETGKIAVTLLVIRAFSVSQSESRA